LTLPPELRITGRIARARSGARRSGEFLHSPFVPASPRPRWIPAVDLLNADLTVSLRASRSANDPGRCGFWIGPDGAGLAMARLADSRGYFGRAIQSLVIEKRSRASRRDRSSPRRSLQGILPSKVD